MYTIKDIERAFRLGFESGYGSESLGASDYKWAVNKYFFEPPQGGEATRPTPAPQQEIDLVCSIVGWCRLFGIEPSQDAIDLLRHNLPTWIEIAHPTAPSILSATDGCDCATCKAIRITGCIFDKAEPESQAPAKEGE